MKLEKIIAPDRKVELKRLGDKEVYKTTIQNVTDQHFSVVLPRLYGEWFNVSPGEEIQVVVSGNHERFVFNTRVIIYQDQQVPFIVLEKPQESDIKRIQLRSYVRIKAILEVSYQKVSESDLDNLEAITPSTLAYTVDISGGGVQLAVNEEMKQGDLLYLKINMPGDKEEPIWALGSVRRFIPAGETKIKNLVGIKFERIAERDRDRLIKYIFDKMRKQRWLEVSK